MADMNRRNVLKAVGGAGILLTTGVGTAAARNGRRQGASGDKTIVDIAAGDDRFETLVAAVQEAGLVDTLSGNRQLTVFAPTDAAFEDLADSLGMDVADLLELDNLGAILTFHVTPGRRYASSVVNAPRLPTLNGESIDVDGTVLEPGEDDEANIIVTDIEASNGVIHAIDSVLLPGN